MVICLQLLIKFCKVNIIRALSINTEGFSYNLYNNKMQIINKLINKATSKRLEEIEYFKKNPELVQDKVFRSLINYAKNTLFAQEHNFNSILKKYSYAEFQENVPIRSYENLAPYIERIRKGEHNLLWHSDIKWFAQSSGTTSDKSKFIPVSEQALENCHFRGGKDILAVYNDMFPDSKLFLGRSLVVGGSKQINNIDNNMYYGDLSAVIIENLPFWAQFMRTPEREIALLPEWEEKIEKMSQRTVNQNVTNIAGVPSWTLVLLKRILEISGKNDLTEVWENLELFVHGGVSFTPYKEEFKRLIPSNKMNYLETYSASEGFFAIQDDLNSPDMLLMLDYGIFYEFIPMENFGKENPDTYRINEVETGKNYAVVITTNAGLWRYLIGDTVMFTSKRPYKIKITGRTKHFINAFGEELIIDNAENALAFACKKTNASISDYTAAPKYMNENSTGGHEWIIEFSRLPENIDKFTEILDNSLKEHNSDYEAKRHKNLTLMLPEIHIAPQGLFHNWLKSKGKLGGQNKVLRLANNREYIDELLKLIK